MFSRVRQSDEWRFFGILPRADRPLAFAWWAMVAARATLPALFAIATGGLVAAVQGGRPLGVPLAVAGVVFVALNALGPVHQALGGNLGANASAWLHDRMLEASIEPKGLAHMERPDLADELAKARDFDLGITAPSISYAITEVGHGFVEFGGGLAQAVLLSTYRWWAGLAAGGAWFSTQILLRESGVWRARQSDEVALESRHADYAYRLAVDGPAAKEVRLFGLAAWVTERFRTRRRRFFEMSWTARRLRQRSLVRSVAVILAGNGLVFWSLARDATAGRIEMSSLVVYAQAAVGTSALAFGVLSWWLSVCAQPVPVVLRLWEGMRSAGALPPGSRGAEGLPAREIRFSCVRFAYPAGGAEVFDGLDLRIEAGRSLAIVGQNGAGKTTLAKLLCRLYDPQGGAVLVDGVDLRELDVDSWRARIGAVFQDFVRYELSVRDNVAPTGAPDEVVRRALAQAGADGLADLDTVLSRAYEGGTDLSGGQWQRIALARALCAVHLGAGVVILDEPTAQLDVRGEAEIFDRILQTTRGLTTILISHRFSTVRHADRICVLEHGKVVELGTHEELVGLGGRYRTMFDLQASRFSEEEPDLVELA